MAKFELAWTSILNNADFVRFTDIGNVRGFNGKLKVNYKQNKAIHITQKPIELYDYCFMNFAEKKFKIIDTHGGSFSSAISAYYFGISEFIGCEKEKEMFEKSIKRFEVETMQQVLSL